MKKGFTLIELLAVIAILAIIMLIATPRIMDTIEDARINAYKNDEQMMAKAAETYLGNNVDQLPENIGDTVEITLTDLKTNEFIGEVRDQSGTCDGYVLVTKIKEGYNYNPQLKCGDFNTISSSDDDKLFYHYTFDNYAEATENIIPNSPINAYPKIGNTYLSYDTVQYNSNNFFSIGTIDNVTNNVVTLSTTDHIIYTYDALTPETTGGGVVAGTTYFIKKINDTSFTLHQYDNTPDGSKGYAVHDSVNNDIRININATNFPTMWHAKPHIPNSYMVKEIVPSCFNSLGGENHECIRLHREHNIKEGAAGMAYGVTPSVVAGETYTFSFYYRGVGADDIGESIYLTLFTNPNYWDGTGQVEHVDSIGEWKRYEYTGVAPVTGTTTLYFFPSSGSTIDISEIQVEKKSSPTPFTETTRNDVVLDYSSNSNTSTLYPTTTPTYKSEGYYEFDGVDDGFLMPNFDITENVFTYSMWMKPNGNGDNEPMIVTPQSNGMDQRLRYNQNYQRISINLASSNNTDQRSVSSPSSSVLLNEWSFITFSINNSVVKLYINGELVLESTETLPIGLWNGEWYLGQRANDTYYYGGNIDDVKLYKRVLSAEEIKYQFDVNKAKYID